jgi:hypothetical protein
VPVSTSIRKPFAAIEEADGKVVDAVGRTRPRARRRTQVALAWLPTKRSSLRGSSAPPALRHLDDAGRAAETDDEEIALEALRSRAWPGFPEISGRPWRRLRQRTTPRVSCRPGTMMPAARLRQCRKCRRAIGRSPGD